jgi:hypothetical protein
MTKTNIHPGAVEISGTHYLRNARGDLTPVANVKAMDLLQDDMVRSAIGYAEDLSAELARFQSHSYADIAAFDALLDQEYGVKAKTSTKGNRSFTSFDGSLQVKVCVADQIVFGPELQAAKKLLDELIIERAEGADPLLVALVTQAFKTDKEGKVDTGSILALRRLEVNDDRWGDITRAIDDSVKVFGSKSYLRFYRKGGDGRMEMIPLDLAGVSPSPAAFARQSLRRQVAELQADLVDIAADLGAFEISGPDIDGQYWLVVRCTDAETAIVIRLTGETRLRPAEAHLMQGYLQTALTLAKGERP